MSRRQASDVYKREILGVTRERIRLLRDRALLRLREGVKGNALESFAA